jgi:hypothetical protein
MAKDSLENAEITVPAILIKIAREWHPNLTADQLYERTRRYWKCNPENRRIPPKFAFSIANGEIVQIYEIHSWERYQMSKAVVDTTRLVKVRPPQQYGQVRKGFLGAVTKNRDLVQQIGKSIQHIPFGTGSPFAYVNCD